MQHKSPQTYLMLFFVAVVSVSCSDSHEQASDTSDQQAMDDYPTFQHPVLGEMYDEDVDWIADAANLSISDAPVQVMLCQGNEDGPSSEALAGFDWINANWQRVLKLIQDEAYERFYLPYADANPDLPQFTTPSELWGTEIPICISISSRDDFEVTLRFDWQQANDPHEITFYIEGQKCQTLSVDG